MHLTSLRQALIVAEQLSFRRAAAALGVQPSVVSRRLTALEAEVGLTLFERRSSGVSLSGAGRRYLDAARASLAGLDTAAAAAAQIERGVCGSVTIAFYLLVTTGILRDVFAACHKHHTGIDVNFVELPPADQLTLVRAGDVDAAFLLDIDDTPGLESEQLWEERIFVALPADHPLADLPHLSWSDVRDEDFIVGSSSGGPAAFAWLAARIGRGLVAPSIRQFTVSREGLLGLVGAGFGVTMVSEAATGASIPGVTFKPVDDEGATVSVRMAWLSTNENPELGPFLSQARRIARRSPAQATTGLPD